ncbi:coiled-coil domain-containing protein 18-like [Daktulosphaira vitifoliae]|uniref:coiled-coil domain-containing protein 18-like n=1 Tax=Daktulosphaira vitifoliae TaxID=58002 RepID=UPI0021AABE2E|nr:coiled-coil domain-containing protein 18-like [Daktulosphaira vitifoliae]
MPEDHVSLPPLLLNNFTLKKKYTPENSLKREEIDILSESSNSMMEESLDDIITKSKIVSDTSSSKLSNQSLSNMPEPLSTFHKSNNKININVSKVAIDSQNLVQDSIYIMSLELDDNSKIENPIEKQRVTETSEGGDGLILTEDTNYKLKCVEKAVEELREQFKHVVNSCNYKNEVMTAMAIEFDKVKNELNKVSNQSALRDNDIISDMSTLKKMLTEITNKVNQIILEGKGLKKIISDSRENKRQLKLMTELANSLEERHCSHLEENKSYFDGQLSERNTKINQLTSYLNVKKKEVNELQQYVVDLKKKYEESVVKLEELTKNKSMRLEVSNQKIITSAKNMRKYLQTVVKIYEDCKGSNPKHVKEMNEKLSALDKELQNSVKSTTVN